MKVVNLGENPSVLNNFIAEMRDATIQKDSLRFRTNLERVGQIFAYEISKELTFSEKDVVTPLGTARVATSDTPLVISTILRAGLPLQKGIFDFFDHAETAFLAAFRKYGAGDYFEIRADYCTTPSLEGKTLILADTMLATGSSIEVAIDKLRQEGGEPIAIHLVCPIASTYAVDHQFLGYFTENGQQVFNANREAVQSALSSLSSDTTLYAHWAVPEGSVAKLVYRGQLTLLGTDNPATDTQKYTKKMHFRVYDDESATTPVWTANDQTVTVNKDGSFMAMFGDETLAALIATGLVSHVGVAIGENAGQAIELKPRREIRPVAVVTRALVAEAAGTNPRVGNLVTENALAANNVTISQLEVAGTVTAPGAGPVDVSPVVVGERETLTLLRGGGVNVFSKNRVDLGTTDNVQRGQKIGSDPAPSDGIALITSNKSGTRSLRIPGVIQYCRKGEYVRAPASEPDGVKVTFFPFVGSAR